MRRIELAAPLFVLLLTGCSGPTETSVETSAATPSASPACSTLGSQTVVRYHSRVDSATQHSVHLLNSGLDDGACDQNLPLAGVVTLSYRVAGT